MTREEREEAARIIKEHCYFANLIPQAKEALNMAIKTLEPDPCEDAVSRQAVLNVIKEQEKLASDRVRDTPSSLDNGLHTWVNPAYTRYSTQLSERSQFKTMIQTMPPVNPQPKTGHWIKISPAGIYECSECGQNVMTSDICAYKFCHGCGAKMEPR